MPTPVKRAYGGLSPSPGAISQLASLRGKAFGCNPNERGSTPRRASITNLDCDCGKKYCLTSLDDL